jgi:hypothetical protein
VKQSEIRKRATKQNKPKGRLKLGDVELRQGPEIDAKRVCGKLFKHCRHRLNKQRFGSAVGLASTGHRRFDFDILKMRSMAAQAILFERFRCSHSKQMISGRMGVAQSSSDLVSVAC